MCDWLVGKLVFNFKYDNIDPNCQEINFSWSLIMLLLKSKYIEVLMSLCLHCICVTKGHGEWLHGHHLGCIDSMLFMQSLISERGIYEEFTKTVL